MFKRLLVASAFFVLAILPVTPSLQAQKKTEAPPSFYPKDTKAAPPAKPGDPKPYDDVIPKTAKSLPGVFTVHRVDDKVYYEIPKDGFDKLMLWQAEVVKGPSGVTWGGYSLGSRYLRWDRRGNK